MTPRQEEIAAAVAEHGSHRKAAAALGIHHGAVDAAMRRLRRDPAWSDAAARLGFSSTHAGWIKWPAQDGQPGASVYVRPDRQEALAGVCEALEAYEGRAEPSPMPALPLAADLLNLFLAPDVHMGMHAWAREAGADYSTKIAAQRLGAVVASVIPRLPPAEECVLLFPGDTLHQNDASNRTPRSGHFLDVDGRLLKVAETATTAIISGVDMALMHHARVQVVILPGNHDPEMAQLLALAVRMYFAREPRVIVHDGAGLWWRRTFGKVMLAATHLHAIKFEGIGPYVAAEWPEEWGQTRHRYAFTGHEHRERTRDFPGIHVETLRPVTRRDAYAAGAYQSMSEVSAMTFHRDRGRVSRIYEAIT